MEFFNDILQVINPEHLLNYGGVALLLIIVFIETGLFFGFFLPGDSLLFTAGLFCAAGTITMPIGLLVLLVCLAAILGNVAGYSMGVHAGRALYSREDSFFFRKKHLLIAQDYFARYGGTALIIARFLPVVRTFAPLVAGAAEMPFRKFMFFNIAGSVLWVVLFVLGAYILGQFFPNLKDYLEWIVLGLVVLTAIPIITAYLKKKIVKTNI